jgi:hypothetical protein
MFVTVVAVMCHMLVEQPTIAPDRDCTPEEARVEEIVTDSDMDDHVDMFTCQSGGQAALAKWKSESPIYRTGAWRIGRVKCAPGHYQPAGRA